MKKLLFLLLVPVVVGGQSSSDCQSKFLVETKFGQEYRREIIFPWFVVGQGWESRVVAQYLNRASAGIRVLIFSSLSGWFRGVLGRTSFPLKDGEPPERELGGLVGGLVGGRQAEIHITGSLVGAGELETGIIGVTFFASKESDPCVVNWAFENLLWAQLTFLARDANGVVRWQVSEPGYFVDQLSPRWSAPISLSSISPDGRQFKDFEDAAFAIANAGSNTSKIRVRIFDNFGRPWLDNQGNVLINPLGNDAPEAINTSWYREYQERCLTRYVRLEPQKNFAATIREFFSAKPEDRALCGENPLFRSFPDQSFMGWRGYPNGTSFGFPFGFWGQILFEAIKEDGSIDRDAKIVPVVIQRVGDSLNNVQLGKLPADTSFAEFKARQNQGN